MKSVFSFILFCCIFCTNTITYCQQSFGILYNKDKYPVRVIHNTISKKIKSKTTLLYKNDKVISKSLDKIIINLAPHAYTKRTNDSVIVIMVKNISDSKNLLTQMWESVTSYLGFIKEDFNTTSVVHQRGEFSLPDTLITTVSFIPVKIYCGDGQSFSLYDSGKKEIYTADIQGKNFIEFLPKDLNMKNGMTFQWEIKNGQEERKGKIKILNNEFHKIITNNFQEFEKSIDDQSRQLILKASYLQMLSDVCENEPDLYWLSNQLIEKVKSSENPEAKLIENRCYRHFER